MNDGKQFFKMAKALDFLKKKYSGGQLFIFFDQAFYALFNFGSIFLLSKLASVEVFGTYVIFLSYINVVFIFSTFFLSAPSLVLLPKKNEVRHGFYLGSLLIGNFLVNLILAGLCFWLMRFQEIYVRPEYVLLAPFLMSMFDIFKKFLFGSFKIALKHAAISSIILNLVFFAGMFFYRNNLGLDQILSLYIAAFSIANLYLVFILFLSKIWSPSSSTDVWNAKKDFLKIMSEHYSYSKWIILGGVAFWGYSQGIFIFSKSLAISDFGISKVRTAQNLLGILNIIIISADNYYLPHFSKYIKGKAHIEMKRLVEEIYVKLYKKIFLLVFGAFFFALLFYNLFYGEKYGPGLFLLLIFATIQLLLFFVRPLVIALKSIENTRPFFLAHSVAVIVMFVFGYFAIGRYGHNAMAMTFLMSYLSFSAVVFYFYHQKVHKKS